MGGINGLRASVSNLTRRGVDEIRNPNTINKYEVDDEGYLTLIVGAPKENTQEKVVNSLGDLATIGLAAAGGPEGVLTAQGAKPGYLKAFESIRAYQKAEARALKLSQKPRPNMPFTKSGKEAVKDLNKIKNGGKTVCVNCKVQTVPGKKSKRGVVPPKNETQVDHIDPQSLGGGGVPTNGQILCRDCNIKKSNKVK